MALKPWQRIFVNRSLNMANIKAIGFDMDHTLAPYNHVEFETLAFRKTLDKFIDSGYPEQLADLQFDPTSVIRGLLVDMDRGNLLKVDGHKYVKLAFHGKRALDKDERHKLYNAESFKAENLLSVDTFFALSEVQLFIEIVDFMSKHPNKIQKSYREIYRDLRKFIDLSHADGSIKNEVMADVSRYIARDKHLGSALLRLKDAGKSLFVLTNSDYYYTEAVMSYLLNDSDENHPHWQDYFDQTIVSSRKPAFFTEANKFLEFDPKSGKTKQLRGKLKPDKIYQGGHAQKLQELIGVKGDEILYVGDHIYGDIISSKGLVNWRTMLIVEELDTELANLEQTRTAFDEIIQALREQEELDEAVQRLRSKIRAFKHQIETNEKLSAKKRSYLRKELTKNEEDFNAQSQRLVELGKTIRDMIDKRAAKIHPVWGEVMKVGLEKSRFANQVERYACLYSSRVTNFRSYSPFKRFLSKHDLLPHDFY